VSADPESSPYDPALAVRYEWGAERVRAAAVVALAADPPRNFVAQVETALRAALAQLAFQPELAHLLLVRPFAGDAEALAYYEDWQRRCAEWLRDAAAREPSAYEHPSFFEPALVSDICAQVARQLGADPARLEDLAPGLLELVHACYFGPQRAPRLIDV